MFHLFNNFRAQRLCWMSGEACFHKNNGIQKCQKYKRCDRKSPWYFYWRHITISTDHTSLICRNINPLTWNQTLEHIKLRGQKSYYWHFGLKRYNGDRKGEELPPQALPQQFPRSPPAFLLYLSWKRREIKKVSIFHNVMLLLVSYPFSTLLYNKD